MTGTPLLSQTACVVTVACFFTLAIAAAISRITVRLYKFRHVYADDYFVFLAVSTLIVSVAFFFASLPKLYLFTAVGAGHLPPPKDLLQIGIKTVNYVYADITLCWVTIFAVKFSFLFYFRTLIRRLPKLNVWWWIVFAVCVPIATISTFSSFIACPYTGSESLANCTTSPTYLRKERILIYYSVPADILTDALIISIPICLLRQANLRIGQKIGIGILLCLSLFMVAIAIVRGIIGGIHGTHDQIWSSFWLQMEACVSVLTVCSMMFKTLFVVNKSSKPEKYTTRSPIRLRWGKQNNKTIPKLPEIHTGATMTGMRTVIRENGRTTFGTDTYPLTGNSDRWTLCLDDSTSTNTSEA